MMKLFRIPVGGIYLDIEFDIKNRAMTIQIEDETEIFAYGSDQFNRLREMFDDIQRSLNNITWVATSVCTPLQRLCRDEVALQKEYSGMPIL